MLKPKGITERIYIGYNMSEYKYFTQEEIELRKYKVDNNEYECEDCGTYLTIRAFGLRVEDGGIYKVRPHFYPKTKHVNGFPCAMGVKYVKQNPNAKNKSLKDTVNDMKKYQQKKNKEKNDSSINDVKTSTTRSDNNTNESGSRVRVDNNRGTGHSKRSIKSSLYTNNKTPDKMLDGRNYKYHGSLEYYEDNDNIIFTNIFNGKLIVKKNDIDIQLNNIDTFYVAFEFKASNKVSNNSFTVDEIEIIQ